MNISKTLLRRTLVIITFAGVALSLVFVFLFFLRSPTQNVPIALAANTSALYEQEKVNSGLPVHLEIPKINVDAALESVGLTPQGAVGVPEGPVNAAWFDLGPRPGENGSAVIVGHFGWKNGIPAVFDNLYKLQKGDKIYVEDETGTITTFVVREVRTYDQNEDASSVFNSSDGKAHLNLITCQGVWNKAQKSYSDRLVVFADKE